MNIDEKMKLCFNDKLETNEVLTKNEKKVIASLLYSYKVCKEAKNCTIIRAMTALRKDVGINTNALYDALRNLEELYHMIDRTPGETRTIGKPSKATKFILHFDKIFNPPVESKKFDFSKELESLEKPIDKASIDTDTVIDIDANKDIDTNVEKDEVIVEVPIMKEVRTKKHNINNNPSNIQHNNLSTSTTLNYKSIEESIKQDELEKDLIKEQFEAWARKVNEIRRLKG